MRLAELSESYLAAALVLRRELRRLRAELKRAQTPQLRADLRHRIAALAPILTQCRELAELTAHYYERGYCRNEKYVL